jgi:hypothetical protein
MLPLPEGRVMALKSALLAFLVTVGLALFALIVWAVVHAIMTIPGSGLLHLVVATVFLTFAALWRAAYLDLKDKRVRDAQTPPSSGTQS